MRPAGDFTTRRQRSHHRIVGGSFLEGGGKKCDGHGCIADLMLSVYQTTDRIAMPSGLLGEGSP